MASPAGQGIAETRRSPSDRSVTAIIPCIVSGWPTAEEQNPHGNRGTRSVSGRALRELTPSGRGPKVHHRGPARATQRTCTRKETEGPAQESCRQLTTQRVCVWQRRQRVTWSHSPQKDLPQDLCRVAAAADEITRARQDSQGPATSCSGSGVRRDFFHPLGGGQGTPHFASCSLVYPPSVVLAFSSSSLVTMNLGTPSSESGFRPCLRNGSVEPSTAFEGSGGGGQGCACRPRGGAYRHT